MTSDWKFIWQKAKDWHQADHMVGLATVVETWGSSPRPVGSHLILNDKGIMEGSVSGGCVEGAVLAALEDVMEGKQPRILDFSVSEEDAWSVGLSCGGQIRVLVENMNSKMRLADRVLSSQEEKLLVTEIATGNTELHDNNLDMLVSKLDEDGSRAVFRQLLTQPLELVIVGAVHISQAMVEMANTLGIKALVIDPRTAFAQKERFDGVNLVTDWPDEVLANTHITSGTAIVTLTHDPKLDDAALRIALRSPAFYITSLGSRKTHATRLDRLRSDGFSDEEVGRIHGPAGLDIGAKTPAEIALSVLSQMISVYRRGESL